MRVGDQKLDKKSRCCRCCLLTMASILTRRYVPSLLALQASTLCTRAFVLQHRLPSLAQRHASRRWLSATSAAAAEGAPPIVQLVTYNVLSSHLAEADYFIHCQPEHLDAATRLARLKTKLAAETARGAVVCLQEVSTDWAGELHVFFAQRGYHLATALYGKPNNGYMGVALAWPLARFDVTDVAIERISDTKAWPPAPEPPRPSAAARLASLARGALRALRLAPPAPKPPVDEWREARRRFNQAVAARLVCKASGRRLCVATYHMPCVFWAPRVMTIHTALLFQWGERFAAGDPLVVAGDFNFKPHDAQYALVTSGALPTDAALAPPDDEPWRPDLPSSLRLSSAYAAHAAAGGDGDGGDGGGGAAEDEPDFTNFAQTKRDDEPFVETLDYIFVSREHWAVAGVEPLPHRGAVLGPLPTRDEPSDHILLRAELALR